MSPSGIGVLQIPDTLSARRARDGEHCTVAEVFQAGGRGCAIRGNLADETDVIAMFDAVESAFGRVDALVDSAGIVAPSMPLADMGVARLGQMFDVSVLGAYLARCP